MQCISQLVKRADNAQNCLQAISSIFLIVLVEIEFVLALADIRPSDGANLIQILKILGVRFAPYLSLNNAEWHHHKFEKGGLVKLNEAFFQLLMTMKTAMSHP